MGSRVIEGADARSLSRADKWSLLAPFLRLHGREALAYATLQDGMEYFVTEDGYIAYTTVRHPVFAPRSKSIVLSDPVCAAAARPRLVEAFLASKPRVAFVVVSEEFAAELHARRFKVNCLGYEPEIPIQTYNTLGDWKELDMVKRSRNEARREGITIREEARIETVDRTQCDAITSRWIGGKKVNDHEIWIYARRPVFELEEDVRKFVAYDREGRVAGFAFYDPMYREGKIFGYSANISRCDETRFGRLGTAIHMTAVEQFRSEGKAVLNLCLAPFVKLERGRFNDDLFTKLFFRWSERFGNDIYNFRGLSFHKSKYRGTEKNLYFASNGPMPSNDVYLAFLSADITQSYFKTMGRLLRGMFAALLPKAA